MKIGVQTGGIMDRHNAEETMRLIAEAGFETVDFNIDRLLGYDAIMAGSTESVFDGTAEQLAERMEPWRQAAEKYGLTFGQMHAPYPTYIHDEKTDAYLLDAIGKCIELCGAWHCSHLVVHPAFLQYAQPFSPEEERRVNMERYGSLIPALKRNNVVCCLENMFVNYRTVGKMKQIIGACCSDAAEACSYIDALNAQAGEKRFAFCFDTGHALLLGKDMRRMLAILGSRVECLHIHDNNGMEDQHFAPYTGMMDWNAVTDGLKAIGYSGNLSFETHGAARSFPPELTAACLRLICEAGELFRNKIQM